MHLRPVSVSLLAFLAVTGAKADWWGEYVAGRTRISGYRNVTVNFDTISGDSTAYGEDNQGGLADKRISDLGYIRIEGKKVADLFNFDINIQDSRFQDPQANDVSLDFNKGGWAVGLGDIQGNLGGSNPFVNFNRKLRGVAAGYRTKNFLIKTLHTEARGDPRTVSISGNNTAGPYYLQSSQIVRGSETISVDGVEQKFGEDYKIDYDLGSITFVNNATGASKVISPASTIVATYESLDFNGTAGTIDGAYLGVDVGKYGHLGLTGVRQVAGSNNQTSTRDEQFQGFGLPSVPYILQFQPQLGFPVQIRVDGVLQVDGVDYHFDSSNTSVFFMNRFVPSTSTVDVQYTPISNSSDQGDRTAWGADWTMPVGKGGNLKISEAYGSLSNTTTPRSGSAYGAIFNYAWDKYRLNADVHSVDDNFVSVQTAGFNRNEKAVNLGLTYTPNDERRTDLSWINSDIANITSTGVTRGRVTTATLSQSITATKPGQMPLSLDLEHITSSQVGNESVTDTASLSSRLERGKLATSFGISDSRIGGDTQANIASLNTSSRYAVSKKMFLQLGASLNNITTPTQSGIGRDISLTAGYNPSDRLTTRLSLTDSDSGGVDSLGNYTNGSGLGLTGNGFTNAPDVNSTYAAASGTRLQFDVEAKPSDKTVFGLSAYSFLERGSVTSNSTTQGINTYMTVESSSSLRLQGLLGLSRTAYDGSDSTPTSTTFSLDAEGDIAKRWSYSTRLTSLMSSGNTGFDQNNSTIEGSLNYALAKRQTLSLSYSGSHTTGYLPQDQTDLSLTYRYQLWKMLGINLSYQDQRVINNDPTVTSGAYRSTGFHLQFSFQFGN